MKSPFLLLALLAATVASAADRPALSFVSPLGVDLRSLHLESAKSRFGTAPITSKSKYQEQVCYLWPNALVTYSGSDEFWMTFELSEIPEKVPSDCVKVKAADAKLPLSVKGLHLGMKEQEFVSIVGEQPELKDGLLVVQFKWTEVVKNLPPAGRGVAESITQVRIEGGFSNQRLTTLLINYGTSL